MWQKKPDRQQALEQQVRSLTETVRALQTRVNDLSRLVTQQGEVEAISTEAESAAVSEKERVKPEILAAMTAAATAFLGKGARIRSARASAASQDAAGAWAQQGRVVVQTSHNLRSPR